MRRHRLLRSAIPIVLSCLLLALGLSGAFMKTARAAANTVSIDKATTFQTIWGFGAAANHPVYDLYNKFSASQQTALLDKLFRTDGSNAGLSVIRLEINPFQNASQDTTGRNQLTFEPFDGTFNWDTDQPQRWFAQEAVNRAADVKFEALPWSPPPWMKTNGSATNGGNLRADMQSKFVNYLLLYLDRYRNTYGLDIHWLSIQNEPTNNTPYASCTYSGADLGTVSSLVVDAVHAQFPGVLVGAPEGATRGLSNTLLSGMTATQRGKLDWIPTHDYTGASNVLAGYGKPVMNTEVWSEAAEDTSVNDAIRWANAVKAALQRNEPGWLFWLALQPIGNNTAEGLVYLHADGTYSIQRRLYALGQFSRFMRYGDRRIQATSSNGNLGVVAAKDASGRAAIVVINGTTGAIDADVTGLTGSSVKVYRTSTSENLANLASVSVSGGVAANISFAAQSITTLIEVTGATATPTATAPPTATPTASATPAPTATATATATPAPINSAQINAGGSAASPFVADMDFNGGATINHANTIDLTGVTNPAPMAVYQTARVASTTGAGTTFSYTIPGFTAGSSHSVRLHFAETFHTAAGQRVFNVSINGTPVLANFDVFAAAGAMNKAVIRTFTSNADASGSYSILFTTVTDKALVSGIEIVPATATPTSTSTPAPTATATPAATATATPAPSATATPTVTATPASSSLSINAGGGAASPFVADIDFVGGTAATNWTGAIDTSAVTSPAPQAVYQAERYGASTYTIPGYVAGSSHVLRLHFCENYFTAAGKRVFNVSINGAAVLANFDIFASAGAIHKATSRQFTATANASGQLVIQLSNVTNNALINGIEVN